MSEAVAAPKPKTFFSKFFARPLNLFVKVTENKSQNIYNYGKNNNLPQDLIFLANNSGVAKKCIGKVTSYTKANGFTEKSLNDMEVNGKQTAEKLLALIANDIATFKGFALNIGRNTSGVIDKVKHVPFQYVRKTLEGDFLVNTTLGSDRVDKSKNQYFAAFTGTKMSVQELGAQVKTNVKTNGEILYCYEPSSDNPYYPVPDYFAGVEDLKTSSELQKYDLESALNGFVPSAILTLIGELDNETKDAEGFTEQDRLEETLAQFNGTEKNDEGLTNRNGLLVLSAKTKDLVPVLQAFDAKAIHEAAIAKRDAIERAVCRWFGVHPVLVGFSDAAILGNTQSIANASNELNNNVTGFQTLIEAAFETIWPGKGWKLTTFRPVNYISETVLADLTSDERRALYGYEPLVVQGVQDEKLLVERLGIGGTQALTAILTDSVMSEEQKRATLELLFGFSSENATKLIPVTTTPAT